jgi:hypothetical protein
LNGPRSNKWKRDYFPPDGPVREYRPLIISQARWYSRKYYVDFFDVLFEAVTLAQVAERKFDPTRGKFSTLLLWELQRLHRWCQREYRRAHIGLRKPSKLEDWALENIRAKQERDRTREVCWHGGRHDYLEAVDRNIRYGAKLGVALGRGDYARGKPRNYKRWKAAVGREEWPRVAERIARAILPQNDKWLGMRGWVVGDLLGLEGRTMHEAAAALGITKGYASKIVCQIVKAAC